MHINFLEKYIKGGTLSTSSLFEVEGIDVSAIIDIICIIDIIYMLVPSTDGERKEVVRG